MGHGTRQAHRRRGTASTRAASCVTWATTTTASRNSSATASHTPAAAREDAMDFALNDDQLAIRAAVRALCTHFDDDYWLQRDRDGCFPHDFHAAMARDGWLGVAMPADVGGA